MNKPLFAVLFAIAFAASYLLASLALQGALP